MNILLACDTAYYNSWAINCINSIKHYAPWISITIVIVNPHNIQEISKVRYVYDYINFLNEDSKVAYYQAVRFIKCADIFPNNELVMSIDCDTILTRSFSKSEFESICTSICVQRHHKKDRWMAGLVTYGNNNNFRNELKECLLSLPIDQWKYGWDQKILNVLANKFNYKKLEVGIWMSFGKGTGTFLTLKGDQKTATKYLERYNKIWETIHAST
jgi:hypothetical protein